MGGGSPVAGSVLANLYLIGSGTPATSGGNAHAGFTENTANGYLYYQGAPTTGPVLIAIIGSDTAHHALVASDIHFS